MSALPHQIHFCNVNGLYSKYLGIKAALASFPSTSLLTFVEAKIQNDTEKKQRAAKKIKKYPDDNRDAFGLPGFVTHAFPFRADSSGTVHYVHNNLQYRQLPRLHHQSKDGSSIIFSQLCVNGLTFFLGTVYINPAATRDTSNAIIQVVERACRVSSPVLLLGDFNARHPFFGDPILNPNAKARDLVATIRNLSLSVLNTINHRGIATRGKSVLDLAITNRPDLFALAIDAFHILGKNSSPDHLSLSIHVRGPTLATAPPALHARRWCVNKADWSKYHNATQNHFRGFPNINLRPIPDADQAQRWVDEAASLLTSNIVQCADASVPQARPRAPFTYSPLPNQSQYDEIHRLARRVRKLKLRVRDDQRNNNTSTFASIRRSRLILQSGKLHILKTMWTKAAQEHCQQSWQRLLRNIAPESQKVKWKAWKRTVPAGQRTLSSITTTEHSSLPTDLKQSLNNFASFYSKVMSPAPIPNWNEEKQPPRKARDPERASFIASVLDENFPLGLPSSLDTPFTLDEVKDAAKYLRRTTAPGPDNIAAPFLSKGSIPLFTAITNIFNFSWRHSVVPTEWKKANSFAIFKKGNRSDPSAYRLICITSIVMRLFERVVNNRLVDFLEDNQFFSKNQAGFRRQLSTLDNIYRLLRDVYSLLSKGKQLPVVFLDIVKAFDRVPHDLLLYKLHSYASINGKAWGWLRAFLTNRKFRVTQNDQCSDWFAASAGVPQGCVLSPLLFAIYINDLDDDQLRLLRLILSLFADDGAGWPEHQRNQSYLTQYNILHKFLQLIETWSDEWELEFSAIKTQVLLVENKSNPRLPRRPITLNDHEIELVDHYKYLGLVIQSNGKWDQQFNAIVSKASHTANLIARINRRNAPPGPLVTATLVKSILIPQMSYAAQFWRPTKSHFHDLNQLIAVPLRRALGLHRSTSAARVLWEFGIPDFESLRLKCFLQGINRAMRSAWNGNHLPAFLVRDIRDANISSPTFYCRPLSEEFKTICNSYPSASRLPVDKKSLKAIVTSSMGRFLTANPFYKHKWRTIKPTAEQALYLSVDPKPIVCIRARLRLACALTPHRKLIYGLLSSDRCCGETGDSDHVIMRCSKFTSARLKCIRELRQLYRPVDLSTHLVLGLPPPPPQDPELRKDKAFLKLLHHECLVITGEFLLAIDKIAHL
jgi:Reverse transcriptase (RNA-dependent DNA polymerase)/Endonuclease-reverse transcriptase